MFILLSIPFTASAAPDGRYTDLECVATKYERFCESLSQTICQIVNVEEILKAKFPYSFYQEDKYRYSYQTSGVAQISSNDDTYQISIASSYDHMRCNFNRGTGSIDILMRHESSGWEFKGRGYIDVSISGFNTASVSAQRRLPVNGGYNQTEIEFFCWANPHN